MTVCGVILEKKNMTFPNTEKDLVQHSAHYVFKENWSRQNVNTKKVKVGRKPRRRKEGRAEGKRKAAAFSQQ